MVDFEGGFLEYSAGVSDNDGGQFIRATYGTSSSKTISIGSNSDTDDFDYPGATSGNRVPTSGATSFGLDAGNTTFNFNFGTITGGAPGEVVTQFGLTILDRVGFTPAPSVFTATATFSGGGTAVSTTTLSGDATANDEDTFFGFAAPVGESIASVSISNSTGLFTAADDLGFVTAVPEPASMSLLALGLPLLLKRRRA